MPSFGRYPVRPVETLEGGEFIWNDVLGRSNIQRRLPSDVYQAVAAWEEVLDATDKRRPDAGTQKPKE